MSISKANIKKILIIMLGGIGNMIMLTPALRAVRGEYKDAKIYLLVGPYGAENVVKGSDLVDEVIIYNLRKTRLFDLIGKIKREHFDLSISATGINPLKTGLIIFLGGIKYRLGEDIKRRGWFYNIKAHYFNEIHEVDANIKLVEHLGIKVNNKSLYLHTSEKDKEFASQFLSAKRVVSKNPLVAIHPGSGVHQAGFKRWPVERFAELADEIIKEHNARILILGGKEEIGLEEKMVSLMKNEPILTAGRFSLSRTAALIENCHLLIGNDSGLMHIACAVRTPAVAIFGPTDYKKTAPYSNSAVIVRKDLPCSPCYSKGRVKCKTLECFKTITVEDIMLKVRERF
ncbi:MAG: glycosyltransferase family 9 protein [bacterium]